MLMVGEKVISIHALREEGDNRTLPRPRRKCISIHALREEGDWPTIEPMLMQFVISIHALREEGDPQGEVCPHSAREFLSTPSARRATNLRYLVARKPNISIHALREEGDKC